MNLCLKNNHTILPFSLINLPISIKDLTQFCYKRTPKNVLFPKSILICKQRYLNVSRAINLDRSNECSLRRTIVEGMGDFEDEFEEVDNEADYDDIEFH